MWFWKKATKQQMQCSENPNMIREGMNDGPESLNLNAFNNNESDFKGSAPLFCPQQALSGLSRNALSVSTLKPVEAECLEDGGGQSSTFAPEDIVITDPSGVEAVHHQEHGPKGDNNFSESEIFSGSDGIGGSVKKAFQGDLTNHSKEQEIASGHGTIKQSSIDAPSQTSDQNEVKELKDAIAISSEDSTAVQSGDVGHDELERGHTLTMETLSPRPLMKGGLTRAGEPSNLTSWGQLGLIATRLLRRAKPLMVMVTHSQPNAIASMVERVKMCNDADTAAIIPDLIFESNPVSLIQFLNNFAPHCMAFYEGSGEAHYINKLLNFIGAAKDALRLVNGTSYKSDLATLYNVEGQIYLRRFELCGDLNDLKGAIGFFEQGIHCVEEADHGTRAMLLNNLGACLVKRFDRLDNPDDLDQAVKTQQQSVELAPDGHALKSSWLGNLGISLLRRLQRIGDLDDLDQAMKVLQQATDLTPDGHPFKPLWLGNLGITLRIGFERLGDLNNLDQAVKALQRAVDITPDGHPEKAMWSGNLGTSLLARSVRSNSLGDLEQAMKALQQAVDLTSDGHPDKPLWLNRLGISLGTRFKKLGELANLDQAVKMQQQAVDLTPDGHPEKPAWLSDLGISLGTRHGRLGDLADLDRAVKTQQQVINLTPDGHPDKSTRLSSLGVSLLARYGRLGDLDDLHQAVKVQQQAVDLMSDKHPYKPLWLSNLGVALRTRFTRLGNLEDLDQAVKTQQQAMSITPSGHPEKPSWLCNLGISFLTRFGRLGELGDLDRAVKSQQQAVDLTPDGDANKPMWLSNLGISLLAQYGRFRKLGDLERAVSTQQQAVNLTPDGHPDKLMWLGNLGISLGTRFSHLGDLGDLNEAVKTLQQAVDLALDGHAFKPMWLTQLGNSLGVRFKRLGELGDLDQAVKTQQQAVDLTPDGHADKPAWLFTLASFLQTRLSNLPTPQDCSLRISSLRTAATYSSGPPSVRFDAARTLADILHPQLQPYQIAIDLIPQVVWLGKTIEQRYNDLDALGELVMDAVSAACAQGEYDLALEWIEQGRAIIWGQILQLRSPMATLQTVHPDLANELNCMASALQMAATTNTGSSKGASSAEEEAQEHRRLAKKWEDTLAMVRTFPGFADFLKHKSASALKRALADRTVVLVNVSRHHSDALILRPGSNISHVLLPSLSITKVNGARDRLLNALHVSGVRVRDTDRGTAQKGATRGAVPNILQMLWNDVAKPIINHLGYSTPPRSRDLPHVTWCLTGALAVLPLHAAGIYNNANGDDKLFHYVVSSYTPSLTSLVEGLERTPTTPSARSLLAITQECTPKLSPLPATMREVNQVKTTMEKYGISVTRMDGEQAMVKSVSDAMSNHSWIHLACHGKQDATEPTKSAFLLHDGPLQLIDIMKKSLTTAELAYLSACQTASGHAELPNEAIHLAAGMFTAGYRTVVATLWSIRDTDAPTVAQEFYDRLLSNPDGGAARALQEAVGVLRERVGEENLLAWVPYIHIGC